MSDILINETVRFVYDAKPLGTLMSVDGDGMVDSSEGCVAN